MRFPAHCFPFFFLLLVAGSSWGQASVKGIVNDSTKSPVPFAALALLRQADSSIYKGTITDASGHYLFEDVKAGNYFIKISQNGFRDLYSSPFRVDSLSKIELPDLQLVSTGITLSQVSVLTIKDPVEFENGNITLNIEGSPLAIGNNAYELLSRLPGVMVENDVITIEGKTGVKIYIDDREQQMSGAQLVNFLKSLDASSIEKISVITNPTAKYDAAGTAGIIAIKTKKIKITGFSGNADLTYSQGFYYDFNSGLALNYKGKKFALFSRMDSYQGRIRHVSVFNKTVHSNGESTQLDQNGIESERAYFGSASLAADWYINEKNIAGAKVETGPGYADRRFSGSTRISDTSAGYNQLDFTRNVINKWNYLTYSVNAEHLFDTLGSKLNFVFDYYDSYDNYSGAYRNIFLTDGRASLPAHNFTSDPETGLKILSGRLDFEKKLSGTLGLEAGAKASSLNIANTSVLQNQNNQTGEYSTDSLFTSDFSYHESISAAYVNLSKSFKKFNMQLGLRGENTAVHTASYKAGNMYTRQYFDLFPLLSIDYNRSENHKFSFSYNRRIGRPDYNSFNPNRTFDNVLSSGEGNLYLLPEYSTNFRFSYIYRQKIYNSLFFGSSRNSIQNFTSQNDSTKETVQHLENLDHFEFARYSFFIRQNIRSWWVLTFNCGAYYIGYSGKVNGLGFSTSAIPYYGSLNSQFIFPKNFKAELNAYYWSPWLGGASVYKERHGLSLAVKKSMFDNRLNASIALNDILFSETFRSTASFQNQNWQQFNSGDSRRISFSLSYNFGKIKVEERQEQSSEEKERLNH